MPSAIDTTIGGANANSYVAIGGVGGADAYFDDRPSATAWTGATTDDKTRALLEATRRLQRQNWLGGKVTAIQALAWPRVGVQKVDQVGAGYTFGWGYGYSYGYGYLNEVYRTDEIPLPVKHAEMELALFLLINGAPPVPNTRRITSFSADGLSVNYEYIGIATALPDEVNGLISALIEGNKLVRG